MSRDIDLQQEIRRAGDVSPRKIGCSLWFKLSEDQHPRLSETFTYFLAAVEAVEGAGAVLLFSFKMSAQRTRWSFSFGA